MTNAVSTYHSETFVVSNHVTSSQDLDARSIPSLEDGILTDPIVDTNDIWIRYGLRDDHPNVLREKARESYMHKACIERITNLIAGDGIRFEAESDAVEREAELFFERVKLDRLHHNICNQVKLYGGVYPQLIYNTNVFGVGELTDVFLPEFQTVRLGVRTKGKHKYHYYANEWGRISNTRQHYLSAKSYNELDFYDRIDKIIQVPAYDQDNPIKRGTQSHLIGIWSAMQRYYPTPDYFTSAAINLINSAFEISVFNLADLKNGLNLSYVVEIIRKKIADENEESKQKEADRNRVRTQLAGAENSSRAILNWVEPDPDQPNRTGMRVTAIPSGNTADRHKGLRQDIKNGILTIHGVTNPKIVSFPTDKGTSGLGNNAQELVTDFELFEFTSVDPLKRPIIEFYNQMLKDADIDATVEIKPAKPVAVKMAESLMTQVLTQNEIREMFGFEDIEEELIEEGGENGD